MKRVIALCLALVATGCGSEPGVSNIRETYPKVTVKSVNTLLGKALELRFTSDFVGHADGRMNKQTGDFEFKVDVNSNVSGVLPAYTAWGTAVMLPSQQMDNEWHYNLRATIIKGMEIIAPLVGQYIGAWQSLGEAKLMQPSMVTQAAGLLAAAKSGDIAFSAPALWSTFGPELKAALQRIVPGAVPTTQPSP